MDKWCVEKRRKRKKNGCLYKVHYGKNMHWEWGMELGGIGRGGVGGRWAKCGSN